LASRRARAFGGHLIDRETLRAQRTRASQADDRRHCSYSGMSAHIPLLSVDGDRAHDITLRRVADEIKWVARHERKRRRLGGSEYRDVRRFDDRKVRDPVIA